MPAAALGDDAAARRALDEAELEQIGLVHVLDRLLLFAERDRQRGETDRAAAELLDDAAQERAILKLTDLARCYLTPEGEAECTSWPEPVSLTSERWRGQEIATALLANLKRHAA